MYAFRRVKLGASRFKNLWTCLHLKWSFQASFFMFLRPESFIPFSLALSFNARVPGGSLSAFILPIVSNPFILSHIQLSNSNYSVVICSEKNQKVKLLIDSSPLSLAAWIWPTSFLVPASYIAHSNAYYSIFHWSNPTFTSTWQWYPTFLTSFCWTFSFIDHDHYSFLYLLERRLVAPLIATQNLSIL